MSNGFICEYMYKLYCKYYITCIYNFITALYPPPYSTSIEIMIDAATPWPLRKWQQTINFRSQLPHSTAATKSQQISDWACACYFAICMSSVLRIWEKKMNLTVLNSNEIHCRNLSIILRIRTFKMATSRSYTYMNILSVSSKFEQFIEVVRLSLFRWVYVWHQFIFCL